jgi:hypothetical protein
MVKTRPVVLLSNWTIPAHLQNQVMNKSADQGTIDFHDVP